MMAGMMKTDTLHYNIMESLSLSSLLPSHRVFLLIALICQLSFCHAFPGFYHNEAIKSLIFFHFLSWFLKCLYIFLGELVKRDVFVSMQNQHHMFSYPKLIILNKHLRIHTIG